jgi:hypothetical protein
VLLFDPSIFPEIVTVPVEIVSRCLTVVLPLVNAKLAAFRMPAAIISFTPLSARGIVMEPETERVIPELIVKEVAVVVVNLMDVQAAFAVTVTLWPRSI